MLTSAFEFTIAFVIGHINTLLDIMHLYINVCTVSAATVSVGYTQTIVCHRITGCRLVSSSPAAPAADQRDL